MLAKMVDSQDLIDESFNGRSYGTFPAYCEVTAVAVERQEMVIDDFFVRTTSWSEVRTYTWGEPAPFIMVTKRTTYRDRQGQVTKIEESPIEWERRPDSNSRTHRLIPPDPD